MLSLYQLQQTVQLPPIQLANLLRDALRYDQTPARDTPLRAGDCLTIWLWDALVKHQEAPLDQLMFLIREIAPYIQVYADDLMAFLATAENTDSEEPLETPVMLLGIGDGQYATLDDKMIWELRTGRQVPAKDFDPPPVRSVAYNLCSLFFVHYQRYQQGDASALTPAAV